MKVTYDPQVDALYIRFREATPGAVESREVAEGVNADFDPQGRLVGIEVLDATALLGDEKDRVVVELPPARSVSA